MTAPGAPAAMEDAAAAPAPSIAARRRKAAAEARFHRPPRPIYDAL
jgi:hypothetical protein